MILNIFVHLKHNLLIYDHFYGKWEYFEMESEVRRAPMSSVGMSWEQTARFNATEKYSWRHKHATS